MSPEGEKHVCTVLNCNYQWQLLQYIFFLYWCWGGGIKTPDAHKYKGSLSTPSSWNSCIVELLLKIEKMII